MATVYLDLYIMENFCVDYALLHIVGSVMQLGKNRKRLLGAALIGAAGAALPVVLPVGSEVLTQLLWCAVGMVMVRAAFCLPDIRLLFHTFFVLVIVSFLLQGIVEWLGRHSSFPAPILFFAGYAVLDGVRRFCVCQKRKRETIFPVEILYRDQRIRASALLDTGNELRDPLTGLPVMIGEYGAFSRYLPDGYKRLFERFCESGTADYQAMSDNGWSDIRWISYKTIGHQPAMMMGVICDRVQVRTGQKTADCGKAVLAFAAQPFSGKEGYTVILQNNMVH